MNPTLDVVSRTDGLRDSANVVSLTKYPSFADTQTTSNKKPTGWDVKNNCRRELTDEEIKQDSLKQ